MVMLKSNAACGAFHYCTRKQASRRCQTPKHVEVLAERKKWAIAKRGISFGSWAFQGPKHCFDACSATPPSRITCAIHGRHQVANYATTLPHYTRDITCEALALLVCTSMPAAQELTAYDSKCLAQTLDTHCYY